MWRSSEQSFSDEEEGEGRGEEGRGGEGSRSRKYMNAVLRRWPKTSGTDQ